MATLQQFTIVDSFCKGTRSTASTVLWLVWPALLNWVLGRKMLKKAIAIGVLVAVAAVVSNAQIKATTDSPSPRLVASLARSVYKVGEAVEVTVTLENAGKESFYVPKELNNGYDGIGFQVYLLRNAEPYCVVSVQRNCLTKKTKRQNIEQLLSDRFLLLPTGGMIGFHTRLPTTCHFGLPALLPANYEVVVEYSASDGCLPDLSNKRTPFPVLHSKVKGVRMQFELTD
jgi:hypothetical protein